jgi:hypothetical protein
MLPPTTNTPPQAQDIRPIRDAVNIPVPTTPAETHYLTYALWGLGGLVVIIAIIALVRWLKRRAEANRIPNLQQKALRELENAKQLISPEHSRTFSITVSNTLRHFIEGRFKLPSTRQTTPEFLQQLQTNTSLDLGPYHDSLQQFFTQCDFGKFSGDTLTTEQMNTILQSAINVVQVEQHATETNQSPTT